MLSRRTLLGTAAVLAAGCGPLESLFSAPSVPKETELTWVSQRFYDGDDPQRVAATLAQDPENPHGPQQGRYRLTVRTMNQAPSWDDLDAWRELDADLLTLSSVRAKILGESGFLLPLDRFRDANESALEAAFFPGLLNQFRAQGALYALPVSALPVMAFYDVAHFTALGVPSMDPSWNWDDLAHHSATLTQRGADGAVRRWGVDTHGSRLWWALWQNEADMVDTTNSQCRLSESAAIEALQFVHALLHVQRVSPPVLYQDLAKLTPPPAIVYTNPPLRPSGSYRLADIPRGKVRAVPVRAGVGVAIAARTEKPEAAYTALKGLVHAMQRHVVVPAGREAVALLGETRSPWHAGIRPEEVEAIQRSMEAEREMPRMPQGAPELYTMESVIEALVRGDDVATVVNQACSLLREYQQTGGKTQE